jgi:hypothetical protein
VKNFNIKNFGFFLWAVFAILTLSLAIRGKAQLPTRTKTFCAYNKVFVEFEEGDKRWGTLMLNWNGKPIPCNEADEVDINTTI